jgi:hypothetical protein
MDKYYNKYSSVPLNHRIKTSNSLNIPILSKKNFPNLLTILMKK